MPFTKLCTKEHLFTIRLIALLLTPCLVSSELSGTSLSVPNRAEQQLRQIHPLPIRSFAFGDQAFAPIAVAWTFLRRTIHGPGKLIFSLGSLTHEIGRLIDSPMGAESLIQHIPDSAWVTQQFYDATSFRGSKVLDESVPGDDSTAGLEATWRTQLHADGNAVLGEWSEGKRHLRALGRWDPKREEVVLDRPILQAWARLLIVASGEFRFLDKTDYGRLVNQLVFLLENKTIVHERCEVSPTLKTVATRDKIQALRITIGMKSESLLVHAQKRAQETGLQGAMDYIRHMLAQRIDDLAGQLTIAQGKSLPGDLAQRLNDQIPEESAISDLLLLELPLDSLLTEARLPLQSRLEITSMIQGSALRAKIADMTGREFRLLATHNAHSGGCSQPIYVLTASGSEVAEDLIGIRVVGQQSRPLATRAHRQKTLTGRLIYVVDSAEKRPDFFISERGLEFLRQVESIYFTLLPYNEARQWRPGLIQEITREFIEHAEDAFDIFRRHHIDSATDRLDILKVLPPVRSNPAKTGNIEAELGSAFQIAHAAEKMLEVTRGMDNQQLEKLSMAMDSPAEHLWHGTSAERPMVEARRELALALKSSGVERKHHREAALHLYRVAQRSMAAEWIDLPGTTLTPLEDTIVRQVHQALGWGIAVHVNETTKVVELSADGALSEIERLDISWIDRRLSELSLQARGMNIWVEVQRNPLSARSVLLHLHARPKLFEALQRLTSEQAFELAVSQERMFRTLASGPNRAPSFDEPEKEPVQAEALPLETVNRTQVPTEFKTRYPAWSRNHGYLDEALRWALQVEVTNFGILTDEGIIARMRLWFERLEEKLFSYLESTALQANDPNRAPKLLLEVSVSAMMALRVRLNPSKPLHLYQQVPESQLVLITEMALRGQRICLSHEWYPITFEAQHPTPRMIEICYTLQGNSYVADEFKHEGFSFSGDAFIEHAAKWADDHNGRSRSTLRGFRFATPTLSEWRSIVQSDGFLAQAKHSYQQLSPDLFTIAQSQEKTAGLIVRQPIFASSVNADLAHYSTEVEVLVQDPSFDRPRWFSFSDFQRYRQRLSVLPPEAAQAIGPWIQSLRWSGRWDDPGMLFKSEDEWWRTKNKRMTRHEGVDFVVPAGDPVPALLDGVVVQVELPGELMGKSILVKHPHLRDAQGRIFHTLYAHVDPAVKVGDVVKAGQLLGNVFHADPAKGAPSHLHLTTAWIPEAMEGKTITWDHINPNYNPIILVDPLSGNPSSLEMRWEAAGPSPQWGGPERQVVQGMNNLFSRLSGELLPLFHIYKSVLSQNTLSAA